jgi:hypothetical protein
MQNTQLAGRPHRNHGLFSDHYLNVTLPARPDWKALADESRPVMEEIAALLEAYTPSENEAQVEEDLVRPILRLLGHTWVCSLLPLPYTASVNLRKAGPTPQSTLARGGRW